MPLSQPPKVSSPGFDDWMWRFWKLTGAPNAAASDHALLSNLNSTTYSHLTAAQLTDLTDSGATTLHTHMGLLHHVDAYGAVGDGSTNDSTAIQSAIDAALAGTGGSNTVVFGPKTYKITTGLVVALGASSTSKTINIVGAGSSGPKATFIKVADNLIGLYFSSGAGTGDDWKHNSVTVRDLGMVTSAGASATGTTAIKFGTTAKQLDSYSRLLLQNVYTENFNTGLSCLNTRNLSCIDVVLRGVDVAQSKSLYITAETGYYASEYYFVNCEFSTKPGTSTTAVPAHVYNGGTGTIAGLHFTDTFFYYGENASLFLEMDAAGLIEDVFINHCQFDYDGSQNSESAIKVSNSAGTIENIMVDGCYIAGFANGLYFATGDPTGNIRIVNNYFDAIASSNGAVYIQNAHGVVVSNNTFSVCGDNTTNASNAAIHIASTDGVTITGNVHRGTTTSNLYNLVTLNTVDVVSINGNSMQYKSGGAIYAGTSVTNLSPATITDTNSGTT